MKNETINKIIMTKKSNSFIKTAVIVALLLLGIAAWPAAGHETTFNGTNAVAVREERSAVANASHEINISFTTGNNTLGNWSVNVTNPLNTNGIQLDSNWINISSEGLTPPLNVVGANNTLLNTDKFSSNNGTIYVFLRTTNATRPYTFNVTFQNLDNLSENVVATENRFVAGPITTITITNLTTSAVANNIEKFEMKATAFDNYNNPVIDAIINLSSNRSQDTITPTSVITNTTIGAAALFNITSTLAGVANITGTNITSNVSGSNTNVVFISEKVTPIGVDINLTGPLVVGISAKDFLAADYRNFNINDPYNITITRLSDGFEEFSTDGVLAGGSKQTIPIDWKPLTKGNYRVVAKSDTTIAAKETLVDMEIVSPIPELSTLALMSAGLIGLFGLTGWNRRKL